MPPFATFETIQDVSALLQANRPQEALQCAERILARTGAAPDPDLLNLAGVAAFQIQDIDTATAMLRRSNEVKPGNPEVHFNLGLMEAARGRSEDAVRDFENAIALQPGHPQAYANLGNAYRELGRFEDAERAYKNAIDLAPDYPLAMENLGGLLLQTGRSDDAAETYRRLLKLTPDNIEALRGLIRAEIDTGQLTLATATLSTARAMAPSDPDLCFLESLVRQKADDLESALFLCERAIELAPDHADYKLHLGNLQFETGAAELAERTYTDLLQRDPGNVEGIKNLANLVDSQGRRDEAAALVEKGLHLDPDDVDLRLRQVSLGMNQAQRPDPDDLERLLARDDLSVTQRRNVQFILAKLYDGLGVHDRAFEHYADANARVAASLSYDVSVDVETMRKIRKVCSAEFIDGVAGGGFASDMPIFIVGMPRTGTTLVEQILSSHPDVFGAGELSTLPRLAAAVENPGGPAAAYPDWMTKVDPEAYGELGQTYVASLRKLSGGAGKVCDKLPGNFLYLGLLRLALPEAKVVHCIRDPFATCFSCYQKNFSDALRFTWDLEDLGRYYLAYRELMDHWSDVLGDWVLDVHYETMVANQEVETRRLLEFCGLDWDEACLNFFESKRLVRTSMSVRKPMYSSAVEHWRSYDEYLGPLRKVLERA